MRCLLILLLVASVSLDRITAAQETGPRTVWTYDARPLRSVDLARRGNARQVWDTMHVLAALQGLVNRDAPRLYVFYCHEFGVDTDEFWFGWFCGEDGWLRATGIHALPNLDLALAQFKKMYDGLVVYDENVPATAVIASTAAGVENLLPIRFDSATNSLFQHLVQEERLPVKLWLIRQDGSPLFTGHDPVPGLAAPPSGSPKIDAYRWAQARYLDSGRCDPGVAAYYVDAFWLTRPAQAQADMHTLSNHDWFIAHRAFFFDLSPWGDEVPVDDPKQRLGSDKRCLLNILASLQRHAHEKMVRIGGFPPWPFKYTTDGHAGHHGGVPTEWEFTHLISQFNAYKEADAAGLGAIANASFFQHYPLKRTYRQPNPKPNLTDWRARGWVDAAGNVVPRLYVGHYVGDYDSPSWLYKAVPAFFRDAQRGLVPLGWAFDPNLADRAPQALAYAYEHASTPDFFIAGDSGAGYLNPRALTVRPDSGLPSGLGIWEEHCRASYARWGMTITGFILDGSSGASTDREFAAYRRFAPDGAGTHFERGPAMRAGLPTCPENDLPDSSEAAADFIARRAQGVRNRPEFLWARSILRSPSWYADVSRQLQQRHPDAAVAVVDPYSFFGLIRANLTRGAAH